jgi:hypothetical protein
LITKVKVDPLDAEIHSAVQGDTKITNKLHQKSYCLYKMLDALTNIDVFREYSELNIWFFVSFGKPEKGGYTTCTIAKPLKQADGLTEKHF